MAEVFRALTDGVFADLPADGKNGGKSSVVPRNLQRAYVARLGELVLGPKSDFGGEFIIFLGGLSAAGRRRPTPAAWPGST